MAVNLFTGATNNNSNVAANWSQGTIPTANDGHVTTFDATSPNCTINATLNCNALDLTGYTNTLTRSNPIIVSGNLTLDANTATMAGTSGITVNAASTITSNGRVWDTSFTCTGAVVFTISGVFYITGTYTQSTSSATFNGSDLHFEGNATLRTTVSGTCKFIFSGGATQTVTAPTVNIINDIEVNKSGGTLNITNTTFGINTKTLTFTSNTTTDFTNSTLTIAGGTVVYTAGTITTTGSTLSLTNSCTLNTGSISWNNITCNTAAATLTINSTLNYGGTFTLPNGAYTFAGTNGISGVTLTTAALTGGRTYTLAAGKTYTFTNIVITASASTTVSFVSSVSSSDAYLILTTGVGTQKLVSVKATDINSSGGEPIRSVGIRPQDLTRTTNWTNNSGQFLMFMR